MSEQARARHFTNRLRDVDFVAKTCTCPAHGPNAPIRLGARSSGSAYECEQCDDVMAARNASRAAVKSKDTRTTVERRRNHLSKKYGITLEEYEIRIAAQQGRCLICRDELVKPFVDHCHEIGHVRGILCHRCNSGLGFFRDNPDTLRRAIQYLSRYRADPA